MAIDYEAIARAGGFGKGEPLAAQLKSAKVKWQVIDERESRKVCRRSGGQCEVAISGQRCARRAWQVHHHKGGFGVRGRGESAMMKHKTHVCTECHDRITGKRLVHISGNRYRERT